MLTRRRHWGSIGRTACKQPGGSHLRSHKDYVEGLGGLPGASELCQIGISVLLSFWLLHLGAELGGCTRSGHSPRTRGQANRSAQKIPRCALSSGCTGTSVSTAELRDAWNQSWRPRSIALHRARPAAPPSPWTFDSGIGLLAGCCIEIDIIESLSELNMLKGRPNSRGLRETSFVWGFCSARGVARRRTTTMSGGERKAAQVVVFTTSGARKVTGSLTRGAPCGLGVWCGQTGGIFPGDCQVSSLPVLCIQGAAIASRPRPFLWKHASNLRSTTCQGSRPW